MGKPYVSNIEKNAGKLNFELRNCLRWLLLMQNSAWGRCKAFYTIGKSQKLVYSKRVYVAMPQYVDSGHPLYAIPIFFLKDHPTSNGRWLPMKTPCGESKQEVKSLNTNIGLWYTPASRPINYAIVYWSFATSLLLHSLNREIKGKKEIAWFPIPLLQRELNQIGSCMSFPTLRLCLNKAP